MKFTSEDRRAADDFLFNEIEHICKMLEKTDYKVPDNIMADDWQDFIDGIRYGTDFIIESTEVLIELLNKFDADRFSNEIRMLKIRMNQWIKVHGEDFQESKEMNNDILKKIVGVLFDMDNFVLSVYDNESWLTYGVPDGEFDEDTRERAEANVKDHDWLVTDGDAIEVDDFADFISAFKGCTRNAKDYDQEKRNSILKEAEELLNTLKADDAEDKNAEGEVMVESPKYLTKEQVADYLKKAKLNEQLMMEGPLDGLRNKMRDAHRARDIKKSQGGADRIIRDARDPEISSNDTFIVDGKEYKFNDAKKLSDEQLANAIVIDKFGYYRRRALQDVEKKHEFRHSKSQDWIKDEYRYGAKKGVETPDETGADKGGKPGDKQSDASSDAPKMKGDHRDWTYILKNGKAVNWSDLQKGIKDKTINPAEYKDITVVDKAKKKFSWEDANKVIDVQMDKYRTDRAARDKKIADKEQSVADKKARKEQAAKDKADAKADKDATKAAVKKTKDAEKKQKPVGRLRFFDKSGKEIGERQYKKLTTDQKRQYIAKDRNGNKFSYNDLLMHRKVQKRLNASLEHDPNKDILESLDWDAVGSNLNESISRKHRDDTFTESYTRAKSDVEYDDDTASLDYLV